MTDYIMLSRVSQQTIRFVEKVCMHGVSAGSMAIEEASQVLDMAVQLVVVVSCM